MNDGDFKKVRMRYKICTYLLLVFIILAVITFAKFGAAGFVFVVPAVITGVIAKKSQDTGKDYFKSDIVRPALDKCDFISELNYSPETGISKEEVLGLHILKCGNEYESNDLITGKYNGTYFRRCDVKITEHQSWGEGDYTESTLFAGPWVEFKCPGRCNCNIQIQTKKMYSVLRLENLPYSGNFGDKGFIYTDDEAAATMFLSPVVTQAIAKYCDRFNKPGLFTVLDGVVRVAVDTGNDSYEGYEVNNKNADEERQSVIDDMRAIADLIDGLSY